MVVVAGKGPQGQLRDAQMSDRGAQHVKQAGYHRIGSEHVTSTAATAKTLTVPAGATYARIVVTAADIYWAEFLSQTPASGVGDEALIGDEIHVYGNDALNNFSAVRQASSNFTLKVTYYTEVDYLA